MVDCNRFQDVHIYKFIYIYRFSKEDKDDKFKNLIHISI